MCSSRVSKPPESGVRVPRAGFRAPHGRFVPGAGCRPCLTFVKDRGPGRDRYAGSSFVKDGHRAQAIRYLRPGRRCHGAPDHGTTCAELGHRLQPARPAGSGLSPMLSSRDSLLERGGPDCSPLAGRPARIHRICALCRRLGAMRPSLVSTPGPAGGFVPVTGRMGRAGRFFGRIEGQAPLGGQDVGEAMVTGSADHSVWAMKSDRFAIRPARRPDSMGSDLERLLGRTPYDDPSCFRSAALRL